MEECAFLSSLLFLDSSGLYIVKWFEHWGGYIVQQPQFWKALLEHSFFKDCLQNVCYQGVWWQWMHLSFVKDDVANVNK